MNTLDGQEPWSRDLADSALFEPLPVLRNGPAADRASAYAGGIKRSLDVVISIVALAFFSVVLALIAPAIKLDSRGPVFFRQSRIGIDRRRRIFPEPSHLDRRHVSNPGRPFRIFKLRTMRLDAEAHGPRLAIQDDERVTRVGRILRKFRLDEFPQFVNVLRGEMSVVGPRPERLYFIRQFEHDVPHYRERLAVLPGITGLAQIVNGYDSDLASVRRKVDLDRRYIADLCLRTDLRILARTFGVLLNGGG
jgi:lipopolysaccharide/colanic/teichoic acid biosynthesis glycosyltransferase